MKNTELRIGNLVSISLKSGNGRTIIGKIGCQDIVKLTENIGSFNYEPIELTEEWLLKFGFIKNPNFKEVYIFNNIVIYCKDNWLYDTLNSSIKIEFIHQLQNLYFVLVGEELNEL